MIKVDIVILYEKALRELEVATFLKFYFEKKYSKKVVILQQNYDKLYIWKYSPKIVLIPFCYQNRSHNIYFLKWRDAIFVNLAWEQLLYKGNINAKTPKGDLALSHVYHHSWGSNNTQRLINNGVKSDLIFENGNLSLDLYLPHYKSFYLSKNELADEFNLDANNKWILFNENFNWAFYDNSMIQQMIADGQDAKEIQQMIEYNNEAFKKCLEWLILFLNKNPDYILIFRPRPMTSVDQIKKKIHDFNLIIPSNFIFNKSHSVRNWIFSSDFVVSTYSTTLLEAAISGKPTFMLEPIPIPKVLNVEWHEYVNKIYSLSDLEFAFNQTIFNNNELLDWIDKNILSKRNTIQNLIRFIFEKLESNTYPNKIPLKSIFIHPVKIINKELFRVILLVHESIKFLINRFLNRIDKEYKFDYSMLKNVDKMIQRWNITYKRTSNDQ